MSRYVLKKWDYNDQKKSSVEFMCWVGAFLMSLNSTAGFSGEVWIPPSGQPRPRQSWGAVSHSVGDSAFLSDKSSSRSSDVQKWMWRDFRTKFYEYFSPHWLLAGCVQCVQQGEGRARCGTSLRAEHQCRAIKHTLTSALGNLLNPFWTRQDF